MKTSIVLSVLNLNNPLVKLLLPLAGIAAVVFLCRQKLNISLKNDLRLVKPPMKSLVIWVAANMAWMLLTDYLINWRGDWDFSIWETQPFYVSLLRILAVCFAGPVFEELIFRGLLFFKFNSRYSNNQWIIMLVLAAIWSLIHYDYSATVIFIIFIEGVLLGAALIKSRSLYVPIAMHICWNLYAIW